MIEKNKIKTGKLSSNASRELLKLKFTALEGGGSRQKQEKQICAVIFEFLRLFDMCATDTHAF